MFFCARLKRVKTEHLKGPQSPLPVAKALEMRTEIQWASSPQVQLCQV